MIPFEIPDTVSIKAEHHFDFASIRVRSDDLVQINTQENQLITIKETLQIHNKVNQLANAPFFILHVPGIHTNVDHETRKYLSSEEGLKNRAAIAFVIRSMAQAIVANFYMKVNKPKIPVRFFNTQKEAEGWLHSLMIPVTK